MTVVPFDSRRLTRKLGYYYVHRDEFVSRLFARRVAPPRRDADIKGE